MAWRLTRRISTNAPQKLISTQVLMVVGYDVDDPNFQFRDPPPDPWASIILYGTMTFFAQISRRLGAHPTHCS